MSGWLWCGVRRASGVRRDQLEHLIRAAGALIGDDTMIVIGSQAILATVPAPAEEQLTRSMEADLLPLDDPLVEKADLIDGVLGAGSMFDDTHGIHADGVSIATPVLPAGWRERLVEISNENTNGIRGLCLEVHDLTVSKLAAGRPKGLEFCDAAARVGLVDAAVVADRIRSTELTPAARARLLAWTTRWMA